MGLLALGTPLDWPATKPLAEHIRAHGITQFLHTWDRWKDRSGKGLLWGDEIEYMVVTFDDATKAARLSLRQTEILKKLQTATLDPKLEAFKPEGCSTIPTFHPEYGRYMLESTPGCPFGGSPRDLVAVEADMRFRRQIIRSHLLPHEVPVTVTSWPRLGASDGPPFTDPETTAEPDRSSSRSQYVGELITNPHARFPSTLTANIRQRRGSLVDIRVPLFIDEHTRLPAGVSAPLSLSQSVPQPAKPTGDTPYIHMDAMAFGMGCCCLQITFQAWNVDEARRVYDALVPVAPIMLADVDARWNVIAASVDDRTEEERGLKPLTNDKYRIQKSRYDSVDLYIANDERNRPEWNDVDAGINEEVRQRLLAHGIDNQLASHVAHLFIRDPLVQFSETIDQDDESSMDHFENIQSTNWQTIRFKPPPVNSSIGWRVEFRSMEVQMTDFENAAFSVFIVLLTRAIISFDLDFYMPISKVDDNMQRAQQRNGVHANKFHFRRSVFPPERPVFDPSSRPVSRPISPDAPATPSAGANGASNGSANGTHTLRHVPSMSSCASSDDSTDELEVAEMTIDQVMNGHGGFPGLLGLVNAYLNSINVDVETKCRLRRYLELIKRRARGELVTPASWIRSFITGHPAYKRDSVVSDLINYDLARAVDEIAAYGQRQSC